MSIKKLAEVVQEVEQEVNQEVEVEAVLLLGLAGGSCGWVAG